MTRWRDGAANWLPGFYLETYYLIWSVLKVIPEGGSVSTSILPFKRNSVNRNVLQSKLAKQYAVGRGHFANTDGDGEIHSTYSYFTSMDDEILCTPSPLLWHTLHLHQKSPISLFFLVKYVFQCSSTKYLHKTNPLGKMFQNIPSRGQFAGWSEDIIWWWKLWSEEFC